MYFSWTHGRMDVATQLDLTAVVSPHPELKDDADSEQHGRFNSVQFTCPRNERGFTDKWLLDMKLTMNFTWVK